MGAPAPGDRVMPANCGTNEPLSSWTRLLHNGSAPTTLALIMPLPTAGSLAAVTRRVLLI